LAEHPQLTISRIFREKDKSQFLLVFGLPVYTLLAGIFFIFTAKKLLFGNVFTLGLLAKTSLIFISFISFISFIYLFYWLLQVWKYKRLIF